MITILGVGHVFDIRERVKSEILLRNPAVVAVELDRNRFEALKSQQSSGDAPILYRAMAFIQKRIAGEFDVAPGEEMLAAVEAAQEIGSGVAFIDLPADTVFRKMISSMSIKEKIYFAFGMVAGLFASKEKIEKELDRYQEQEDDYMEVLAQNMPSVSRVLIDERNDHMSEGIKHLEEKYGSVVAVVGDGHIKGIYDNLGRGDVEVIRLKEIQTTAEGDFTVSYHFNGQ